MIAPPYPAHSPCGERTIAQFFDGREKRAQSPKDAAWGRLLSSGASGGTDISRRMTGRGGLCGLTVSMERFGLGGGLTAFAIALRADILPSRPEERRSARSGSCSARRGTKLARSPSRIISAKKATPRHMAISTNGGCFTTIRAIRTPISRQSVPLIATPPSLAAFIVPDEMHFRQALDRCRDHCLANVHTDASLCELRVDADCVRQARVTVTREAFEEFGFQARDKTRAVVSQRGIELDQRCAGADFRVGVRAGRDTTDADKHEARADALAHGAKQRRRRREKWYTGKPTRLLCVGTFERGRSRDSGVADNQAFDAARKRDGGNIVCDRGVDVGCDLQKQRYAQSHPGACFRHRR